MRLLGSHKDADGRFIFTVYDHDIPPYAILSHTWGPDDQEVSYNDLVENNKFDTTGYQKLQFCAQQALKDGLDYFWVDTCCINKADLNELSESINSMFRWYQNSSRCYVFLSDFDMTISSPSWEEVFQRHRWFTRGWTLQELVAPQSVEFFNTKGVRLGDKQSLEAIIHQTTGISRLALQGKTITDFDSEERLKWAATRETKKPEDWAYCLIGIFDISMGLRYGEGREHAVNRLKKKIAQATTQTQDLVPHRQGTWLVPFERNPSFTGRESELLELRRKLFAGDHTSKVAITGLGGVGKTQLVLELLYRTWIEFKNCSIIWIQASSRERLEQGYLTAARQLHIPGSEEKDADIKQLMQNYLSDDSAGHWLIIFDNADNIDMWVDVPPGQSQRLIDSLPRSSTGSIVFTSRDQKAAVKLAGANVVEVSILDEAKSIEMLGEYLIDPSIVATQHDKAAALVRQLAYLPIAIVQAAMYMNSNRANLKDYLSLLEQQETEVIELLSEDFEDAGRSRDIHNPVSTTWLISFNRIRECDPLAAQFLSFMGCVDSKDIPLSMLPQGSSKKTEADALGTLQAYSFITKQAGGLAVTLHRLVHLATRNWLRREGRLPESISTAVMRLDDLLIKPDHVERAAWRSYMPHAAYILDTEALGLELKDQNKHKHEERDNSDSSPNAAKEVEVQPRSSTHRAARKLVRFFKGDKKDQAAWKFSKSRSPVAPEATVVQSESEDDWEPDLSLLCGYARCLDLEGRYQEAEIRYRKAADILQSKFGDGHRNPLVVMGLLASIMRRQGRVADAKKLELHVFEKRRENLGADHDETLIAMNNLALTCSSEGRWDEAEKLQTEVLRIRKIKSGMDHLETLTCMGNLALTYQKQELWDKAEELQAEAVERMKKTLGVAHPHTLANISGLANTYQSQGRWDEVEQLRIQDFGFCKEKLGPDHPDTLTSMGNLALLYRNQGRLDEAEELQVEALERRKKTLGASHFETLTSMSNLALTCQDQGQWDKADELQAEVLERRRATLGANHESTLISMHNLAWGWRERGRHTEAYDLLQQCVDLREQKLGPDDQYAKSSRRMLETWRMEDETQTVVDV